MATNSERDAEALERLSALVDGELDGQAVGQACGQWRDDAAARASWHLYHVIGDVLRSEDLGGDAARDAAFLQALRVRMRDEPVVLAPQPLPAAPALRNARGSRWSWVAPSAVAAGFVAVAGVVMLTRTPDGRPSVDVAQRAPAALPATALASVAASEPQSLVASGQLIRDARLDRYLAAHKQFAGSSALGVPSGFLRNATAIESER